MSHFAAAATTNGGARGGRWRPCTDGHYDRSANSLRDSYRRLASVDAGDDACRWWRSTTLWRCAASANSITSYCATAVECCANAVTRCSRTFACCTIAYLCTASTTPLQSHLVRMPNGELVRFAQQPQALAITPAVGAQPRRQFFARDPRTGALRPLTMAELSKLRLPITPAMTGVLMGATHAPPPPTTSYFAENTRLPSEKAVPDVHCNGYATEAGDMAAFSTPLSTDDHTPTALSALNERSRKQSEYECIRCVRISLLQPCRRRTSLLRHRRCTRPTV